MVISYNRYSFAALTYRLPRLNRASCMFQERYCARDFLQALQTQLRTAQSMWEPKEGYWRPSTVSGFPSCELVINFLVNRMKNSFAQRLLQGRFSFSARLFLESLENPGMIEPTKAIERYLPIVDRWNCSKRNPLPTFQEILVTIANTISYLQEENLAILFWQS